MSAGRKLSYGRNYSSLASTRLQGHPAPAAQKGNGRNFPAILNQSSRKVESTIACATIFTTQRDGCHVANW
jgi:hypothetical protein